MLRHLLTLLCALHLTLAPMAVRGAEGVFLHQTAEARSPACVATLTAVDVASAGMSLYTCGRDQTLSACTAAAAEALPVGLDRGAKVLLKHGNGPTETLTEATLKVAPDGKRTVEVAPNRTFNVDTSRATRGTPEYELLNRPPPNTRIELDNGTTFRTGAGGYVDEITYQPVNRRGVRDGRQTAVGREGIAGDVGGHIQACRHGGTCDRFNLFPQNGTFNNRAYRAWENTITEALQNGDNVGNVTVRFNRIDPNNPRPDSLEIEYQIKGETRILDFRNEA